MDCQFTEQISLLMDDELGDAEARQVSLHLSACAICQQAQADFLLLRRQLQVYQPQTDLKAQRQVLQNLLQSEQAPFWRKKIALPAPAFALLVLALMVVSLWAIASRSNLPPQPAGMTRPVVEDQKQPPTNGFDLSKFDQGERAVIYTVSRTSKSAVQQ
jgi:hypothetical protein